jgi:hypothetical protein
MIEPPDTLRTGIERATLMLDINRGLQGYLGPLEGPPQGDAVKAGWQRERPRTLIEGAVTQVFGVAHGDLDQASRGRARVALARQVAMYLAHVCCGLSFTDVGLLFGRDRTTVAHACGVIEDRRDDPTFDRILELLEWIVPSLLVPQRPAYLLIT